MANLPSKRSPSPLSTRNPRNSETNSAIRRSFSENPFSRPPSLTNPRSFISPTPANSPATTDHTKRHSIGVANSRFQEEKENDKSVKLRSPAKGSKNFMAPTISAVSKFTPSPRKKVLAEKNEIARASVQFSDVSKGPLFTEDSDWKEESTPVAENKMEEGSHGLKAVHKKVVFEAPPVHEVTLNSKTDDASELLPEVTENSYGVDVVELGSKNNRPVSCPSPISPIIAPIDADPSPLPYDPQNNFLSPRPRFLHYKPNPRIEVFLNKEKGGNGCGEGGGNGLEDCCNMSESLSDTDTTEVEDTGDSLKGSSEDLSDMVSEDEQPEIPPNMPISTPIPEQKFEVKEAAEPRFLTRSKIIPLLVVLFLIACFSISSNDSPPMDLSMYKDVSFTDIYHESYKLAAIAKKKFHGFSKSFEQWSVNLVSCLSDLKIHFSETEHKFSSIKFYNLTSAPLPQDEFLFDGYLGTNCLDGKKAKETQEFEIQAAREPEEEVEDEFEEIEGEVEAVEVETYQELEVDDDNGEEESEIEGDVETEVVKETKSDEQVIRGDGDHLPTNFNGEDGSIEMPQISDSKKAVEELPEVKPETEESPEIKPEVEVSDVKAEPEVIRGDGDHLPTNFNGEDGSIEMPQISDSKKAVEELPEVKPETEESPEIKPEVEVFDVKAEVESEIVSAAKSTVADSSVGSSNIITQEPLGSLLTQSVNKFSSQNILPISMTVLLVVVAASILLYMKRKPEIVVHAVEPSTMTKKHTSKQEAVTQMNCETEVGESCPSEMSSYQRSLSYNSKRELRGTSEAQSQDRKPRKSSNKRESLASSSDFSSGSPSYGSFTTYERIPIKHGNEEMMTPIRRSSRLMKNQVMSS